VGKRSSFSGYFTPYFDEIARKSSPRGENSTMKVNKLTIPKNLSTANIILLLVSADFVASDYCYGVEMAKALELHQTGQAYVLPILLRPVDWQDAPFATLQMLPTGAKPITKWNDPEEALENVAKGIRNVVRSFHAQKF
jgi:hypothetical protein